MKGFEPYEEFIFFVISFLYPEGLGVPLLSWKRVIFFINYKLKFILLEKLETLIEI
jgi:hypothetical protein